MGEDYRDIINMLQRVVCFSDSEVKEKYRVIDMAKRLIEQATPKKAES